VLRDELLQRGAHGRRLDGDRAVARGLGAQHGRDADLRHSFKRYSNALPMSLTVVKCGGAALAKEPFELARFVGPAEGAVVVHGAGSRISAALEAAGVPSAFDEGRRITTPEAVPHVREAFARENRALCRQIGSRAIGLMGDDLGLEADRLPGLGEAGMLLPRVPPLLWALLATDAVPVIAPLARGPLNVNADDAAAVLAVALRADRLVFVSDVPGVLVDGEVVPRLSGREVGSLGGALSGGIVPKLQAALLAAREGVRVDVGATVVVA
jgi:acetylglutamate kinase